VSAIVHPPPADASRLRRLARALRRPRNAALAGLLAVLLGVGAYLGGRLLLFAYHLHAARTALDDQDCDAARPHLDACLRLDPDSATVHLTAARGLRRAGFYDDAAGHLREAQRLGDQTADTTLEWAMLGAARGDVPENEPFLQARLDDGAPESGLILESLAQGSIHIYHLGRARHYLELLLAREPDNALGLMWQAWLYEASGRPEKAMENLRQAVRLRPRQPQVRLQLARQALRQNELAFAEEQLAELRRRGYKRPDVLLTLARCRVQAGDPGAAAALLDELLAESPDDSAALVERGRLALQTEGDPEKAERLLRQAALQAPQDRLALNLLVQALSQQGKAAEGEEYATRLQHIEREMKRLEEVYKKMTQTPNDVSLRHEAGVICLNNGQDSEALRWLTGALQLDPSYAPAHASLAEYYERTGQPTLAARHRRLAGGGR
jgi:Tfp pilus assembly protein PilF